MKKILRTRGHGKTYDCIKLCIENNAILITPNKLRADRARENAFYYFKKNIRVYSICDFLNPHNKNLFENEKLVFDDVDTCLQNIIGRNIILGISMDMFD